MKKALILIFCCLFNLTLTAQKELNLEDAVLNQYRAYAPDRISNFEWIPGGTEYSYLLENRTKIVKSNANSKEIQDVISIAKVNEILGTNFPIFYSTKWLSKNEILLSNGQSYCTIDIASKSGEKIHVLEENASEPAYESNSKQLAYLIDHNVMIRDAKSKIIPVTQNTDPNIVSGQAIARSEFGITKGLFWSKNGSFLAFYQKDETPVHDYPLLNNEETPGALMNIKYPMAGQSSEHAKVGIYNTATQKTFFISPRGGKEDYLTNLTFTPDESYVVIAEVNRGQNHMWLNVYSTRDGSYVKTLLEETNDKWVEPETPAYFPCDKENSFVWMSEKDGYMNLYYYDFTGQLATSLTVVVVTLYFGYAIFKAGSPSKANFRLL